MRQIIGMLGARGSGKDTCAAVLVNELGFIRIGFADTLYQEAADAFRTTVEYLGNRKSKELPQTPLALSRCVSVHFVEIALKSATRDRSLRDAALHYFKTGELTPHVSARRTRGVLKAARSPRWTLQLWGTEFRRKSKYGYDSYWLDQVRAAVNAQPGKCFVITDVRFKNEAFFVVSIGGVLHRVRRPALEARDAAERKVTGLAAHPSETELLDHPVDFEFLNEEGQLAQLRLDVLQQAGFLEKKAA
ncbi:MULTISPECIES: hypothetical protein [unclassified Variovorax]|uniref:hypothetical protein n=1 Tax=unclassified Variovorax TaxID=663243 RepID=UPI001318BFA7|nr:MULTISPECIES: hypothetical protein [unclassified Variovorax]VTU41525.1 deoxynucleoside monophosphate kinase [Variovorax sp. SRS16]VTU41548.1 deoxynucleoside monophosphate kinase [Variovorax sp. PBL-E5]VTU44809.1 deoxynucleoside monophosphate kinase [Variovorax sp. PBL-H6]